MEQSKHHDEQENFKEHWEHMRVAPRQQDEGQQGGEASVEHRHAHIHYGRLGPLLPCAWHSQEGVTDVDTEAWLDILSNAREEEINTHTIGKGINDENLGSFLEILKNSVV